LRMQIKIRNQAKSDLFSGFRFYEAQDIGLGDYFLNSLYADIDSLLIYAGIHRVVFGKYHRLLSESFPFAVYYQIKGDTVYVHAVLDCRQNPQRTKGRLV